MGCGASTIVSGPPTPTLPPAPAFWSLYKKGPKLGVGFLSTVHQATHLRTGLSFAVKIIPTRKLRPTDYARLRREVAAMQALREHPNVVRLVERVDEPECVYIVEELMEGGELFERIIKLQRFTERDACTIARTLVSVLAAAHAAGIAHRDLKPENILLASRTDDTSLKLADWGFAGNASAPMATPCGTPMYAAPEVLSGRKYGPACDMWSLGVTLFILLCGCVSFFIAAPFVASYIRSPLNSRRANHHHHHNCHPIRYPPFADDQEARLIASIKTGAYTMLPAHWASVSDTAKDFIQRLLDTDANRRITAAQAAEHAWLAAGGAAEVSLDGAVVQLRRYLARRRLRKAVHGVLMIVRIKLRLGNAAAREARARGADVEEAFYEGARGLSTRVPTDGEAGGGGGGPTSPNA